MMKKKKIWIIALAVVVVAAVLLVHIPKRITGTMTVATGTGETAEVDINLQYYSSLILPSYVKGTITVDGIVYTDQYTALEEFIYVSDHRLFPSDWWMRKATMPYNLSFLRSDLTDTFSKLKNRIEVMNIELNEGVSKIHFMYKDDKNNVDGTNESVYFWGPAQNAEEAKQVADYFGYWEP